MSEPSYARSPIMVVLGVLLIVVGVVLLVGGLVAVVVGFMAAASGGGGGDPAELLEQAMLLFAGVLVLTAGRVLVRGSRRRGARDRFGRLVMLASLVLLGLGIATLITGWQDVFAGMQDVIDGNAPIDSITEDSLVSGVGAVLLPTVGWLLAAAVLDLIGRRLADEPKPLITVSMTADF